jgi:hypothetical protein
MYVFESANSSLCKSLHVIIDTCTKHFVYIGVSICDLNDTFSYIKNMFKLKILKQKNNIPLEKTKHSSIQNKIS